MMRTLTTVIAAVLLAGLASCGGATTDTAEKSSPSAALTNEERADDAVDAVDGAKVTSYGKQLQIVFPIHDNLSEGLRRGGIALDTFKLMESLAKSDVDFTKVGITGTFAMLDKFGKELPDSRVYEAEFTHETINKIQYENVAKTELDVLRGFTPTGSISLAPAFGYQQ